MRNGPGRSGRRLDRQRVTELDGASQVPLKLLRTTGSPAPTMLMPTLLRPRRLTGYDACLTSEGLRSDVVVHAVADYFAVSSRTGGLFRGIVQQKGAQAGRQPGEDSRILSCASRAAAKESALSTRSTDASCDPLKHSPSADSAVGAVSVAVRASGQPYRAGLFCPFRNGVSPPGAPAAQCSGMTACRCKYLLSRVTKPGTSTRYRAFDQHILCRDDRI
jgi:hypothetical protein